jgi:uncharacterized protein (TIRG00374 family)
VGPEELGGALINIQWAWYLPAFLLFLANAIIRAYRWYILLHALNDRPAFSHLLYLYFMGFFANNFVPAGFGGDVVKIVSLRQSHGRGTEALSSVMMERLTGLLGSSLIALIALVWNGVSHTTDVYLPPALWALVLLMSTGIPIGFALIRWTMPLDFLVRYLPFIRRLPKYNYVERLVETVHRYPWPTLLQSLLITFPFTLSLIFIQYSIARALLVRLPLSVFSLFVPIISLINLLPISFNGLGVREGMYQFLFVPLGVSQASALAMSLAFYFLRFSAGLIGGLLYALHSVTQIMRSPQAKNL